jgi:hypothetical protein
VIPAALAAAATYAALVRDEPVAAPPPAGPQPMQAHVPGSVEVAPASPPRPPAFLAQSQYLDLAASPSPAPTSPSVYDLLAGAPLAEQALVGPEVAAGSVVETSEAARSPIAGEPEATVTTHPWQVTSEDTHVPVGDDPPAVAHISPVQSANERADDTWLVPLDEGRFALGGWAASAGHSMVSAVTFRRRLSEDISADRIILEIDASDNVPDGGLVVLADPGFAPDRDGFTLQLAAADHGQFSVAGSYRVLPAG